MTWPASEGETSAMDLQPVLTAYQSAHGAWTGCDWDTEFGPKRLNLCGLTSVQADRLSRATAGEESRQWTLAAAWLSEVESATQRAETAGQNALQSALDGRLNEALRFATDACRQEASFLRSSTWSPLLKAVLELQSHAPANERAG